MYLIYLKYSPGELLKTAELQLRKPADIHRQLMHAKDDNRKQHLDKENYVAKMWLDSDVLILKWGGKENSSSLYILTLAL